MDTQTQIPSHEDLEKYVDQLPLQVINRLPDSPEKQGAITNLAEASRLAHKAREDAKG